MKIIICPVKSDPFFVEIENVESSIDDLKNKIYLTAGIKPENQILIVKGKILEGNTSIKEHNLKNMSRVYISIKKDNKKVQKPVSNPKELAILKMLRKTSTEDLANCLESMKKMLPEYSYLFNDVDTMEEILSESKNPEAQFEKQRAIDRMMDRNENDPDGFQEMVSRYYKIEEMLDKNSESLSNLLDQQTVIPDKPKAPSTTKLPTPYGIEAALSSFFVLLKALPERVGSGSKPNQSLFSSLASMASLMAMDNQSQKNEEKDITQPLIEPSQLETFEGFLQPSEKPFNDLELFPPSTFDQDEVPFFDDISCLDLTTLENDTPNQKAPIKSSSVGTNESSKETSGRGEIRKSLFQSRRKQQDHNPFTQDK